MHRGTALRQPTGGHGGFSELERATRLVRLAHELSRAASHAEAARIVAGEACALLAASYCVVYAAGGHRLGFAASARVPSRARVRRAPAVVARAVATAGTARATAADLAELHGRRLHCREAVALPLVAGGELAGVLLLGAAGVLAPLAGPHVATFHDLAGAALATAQRLEATAAEARRDALTGLPNRRAFDEDLAVAIRRAAAAGDALSLVLLDLDRFKQINDRYGHARGDAVLRQTARVALRSARAGEEVYRLGGEEFAIIVAAGASVAAQVADRVRMGVSQERRLRLPTISAGVACFPDDAAGASALLHRADVALYAAKRTGRDRVVLFAPEHDADRSAAAAESTAALAHPPSGHVIRSIVRSELAALADAVGGIGVAVDRERVLAGACREVARVLAASSCTIRQLRAGCLAPVAASDARRGGYGYRADDFPLVRASLSDGRARAVAIGDAECDPAAADVLDAAGARAGLLVPLRMAGEPWGLLEVLDADRQTFDDDELCVAELIGGHIAAAVARLDHVDDLRRRYREAIAALASALDGRHAVDPHRALAVSDLAVRVGLRLRLPAEELRRVELTGLLHGLVLVGVPVDVLLADTPLDAGGREAVRGGAVDAAATLAEILPLADVPAAVRACRERWDGSGYPDGLAGEQIPVAARVVAACAAWIALNEARPWRPALGERRAERELRAVAGSQLDPASVAALLTVLVDLEAEASPPRLLRPRGAGDGARTS